MGIHSMQVRCSGRQFDVWMVDDDTTNIMDFYDFIKEDLKALDDLDSMFVLDVTANIRKGEHVLKVNNDSTLMRMFNLNTNPSDVIQLEVERVSCIPLVVLPPINGNDVEDVNGDEGGNVEVGLDEGGGDEGGSLEVVRDEGGGHEGGTDEVGRDESGGDEVGGDDNDISDPEWKNGRDYSEEEVSSETIDDGYMVNSDDGHEIDMDDDEPVPHRLRTPEDGGNDPNSNFPEATSHVGLDGRIHLQLWQVFEDYKVFGDVLLDFCIQEGFELEKKKFDVNRVTAICRADGCPWRIHASKSPDRTCFIINTYNEEHTCQQVRKNRMATASWIAGKLLSVLKYDPDMKVHAMRGQIMEKFGIEVDNKTLWKARAQAKEKLEGSHKYSFTKLRCYALMILQTNPGSIAVISSDIVIPPDGNLEAMPVNAPLLVFKRIFLCYEGVSKGFIHGCRPFIGLHGCHLKGPYKGILLAAIGVDANLQFYPIAYAIVEVENIETWKWFIEHLKDAIGETSNGMPWTIMSDRQKGIIQAVPDMPGSYHRFCAWHLWSNFGKKFSGADLKKLFWQAANTANFNEFRNIMAEIKHLNEQAHDYLMNIDVKHWSRSKFDHMPKVDLNTNNHTESFNGWLDGIRHKPPIQLLENLREQHTQLMYTRERYIGKLPPKVKKMIGDATKRSRHCIVRRCGEYEFQVEYEAYKCSVKLDSKFCDCEMWQLSGLPCFHTIACINTVRADVVDYCDSYFSIERWKQCYSGVIHPIPSMNLWPSFENCQLQPPTAGSLPGRPKKHRRRAPGEPRPRSRIQSSTKRCGVCNSFGHNRTTCKATAVPSASRRPPGRPPKQPRTGTGDGRGRGRSTIREEQVGCRRSGSDNEIHNAEVQVQVTSQDVQPADLFGTEESQIGPR